MPKEIEYLPRPLKDKDDYYSKTLDERIEDTRRLDVMCRLPLRRNYWEYRPRVTEEFEEEEARRQEEKGGVLSELMESNIVLRAFFWPWRDSLDECETSAASPPPDEKGFRKRVGEVWQRTKEYISTTRAKLCKVWTHTKEVVYCYWERGTSGWYFETTPVEWTAPLFHPWCCAPTEVYWFPDAYFSNEPRDFNGPLAIGAWPVCDPIPRFPYECEIKCAVLRKWDQYKMWRQKKKCPCDDPSCGGKQPPLEGGTAAKAEDESKWPVRGDGAGEQPRAAEQPREAEDSKKPRRKRRFNCDETCER